MGLEVKTKTVQMVLDRVKRQFGDESGAQLTDDDIIRYINAGTLEIVKANKILKATSTTPSVNGQRAYSFSSLEILQVEFLTYKGKPLDYLTFPEAQELILKADPEFIATGTPYMWYEWGEQLFVYPTPNTDGDPLELFYVPLPDDVTVSTDVLKIPDTYFEALIHFVMSQAYEQDDDMSTAQAKVGQLNTTLVALSQDSDGYRRGTYNTITILADDQ